MKANNLEAAKSQLQAKGINFDLDSIELSDKDALRYNVYIMIDSKSSIVDGQLSVQNLVKKVTYTQKAVDSNPVIREVVSKGNCVLVHSCLEYQIEKAKPKTKTTTGTKKTTKSEA